MMMNSKPPKEEAQRAAEAHLRDVNWTHACEAAVLVRSFGYGESGVYAHNHQPGA